MSTIIYCNITAKIHIQHKLYAVHSILYNFSSTHSHFIFEFKPYVARYTVYYIIKYST